MYVLAGAGGVAVAEVRVALVASFRATQARLGYRLAGAQRAQLNRALGPATSSLYLCSLPLPIYRRTS